MFSIFSISWDKKKGEFDIPLSSLILYRWNSTTLPSLCCGNRCCGGLKIYISIAYKNQGFPSGCYAPWAWVEVKYVIWLHKSPRQRHFSMLLRLFKNRADGYFPPKSCSTPNRNTCGLYHNVGWIPYDTRLTFSRQSRLTSEDQIKVIIPTGSWPGQRSLDYREEQ